MSWLTHVLTTNKYRAFQAETKHSPVKGGTSPKPTSNDNATKDTNNAKNSSNHEEESYTAEENAKIVEMKAVPGTSWNDIKEAIGKKSVSQLKDHYKMHLGPNAEAEQKKAAERAAKAEKNKAEGLAKQAEEGGKKAVEEGGKKCDEASGGGGGGGGKKKKKGGAGEGAADGQGGKNERKEKADANAKEVCSLVRKKLVVSMADLANREATTPKPHPRVSQNRIS